jgi:transcriptional regulator with AAA-type ATPase domain
MIFRCSDLNPEAVLVRARLHPVILSHVETIGHVAAYRLSDALREGDLDPRRVVGTLGAGANPVYSAGTHALMDELGQLRLEVPPLRYRRDDIPAIATHFARNSGLRPDRFQPEVHQLLLRYAWPGNCRELRGVVVDACTAAAASGAPAVGLQHIPVEVRRRASRRPLSPLEQAEADAILAALLACGHNKLHAAALLQISRPRLYRKMRAYGLDGAALG